MSDNKQTNYYTVKQLSEKYPCMSKASIRYLIFTDKGGFTRNIRKIGRKILVNEADFLSWVEEHGGQS